MSIIAPVYAVSAPRADGATIEAALEKIEQRLAAHEPESLVIGQWRVHANLCDVHVRYDSTHRAPWVRAMIDPKSGTACYLYTADTLRAVMLDASVYAANLSAFARNLQALCARMNEPLSESEQLALLRWIGALR